MEAVIAILLVLGFLLYILPKTPALAESSIPEGLNSAREYILTKFLTDNELRDCVKDANFGECYKIGDDDCNITISNLLKDNTPAGFTSYCEICPTTTPCTGYLTEDNARKSIYPGAIFMYYTGDPKFVRVYFWRE